MFNPQANTDPTTTLNLQRIFILRNIAIACELLAIILASRALVMILPLFPLLTIILVHGLFNIITLLRTRRPRPVSSSEFFIQLAFDALMLTALLYFTGGSTNPFVSLFLLPLIVTAVILPSRFVWAMASLTIACYTLLMFFYQPLPHAHHGTDFDLHVLGMWFGFLLSTGLVTFFVVRMANSLRERDKLLASVQEQALRDQHLISLGTLATGAAHELGTPLATMAVLTGELRHDHTDDADVLEKADMLRSQLDRCKSILSDITASAGQARPEGGSRVAIDDYLKTMVSQLQSLRPTAKIACQLDGTQPAPQILADKTLTQALINILNNAADASIDDIQVEGQWNNESLTLTIQDRGAGLTPQAKTAAGTPFFTTKPDGLGLGLYLARSAIGRLGGQVRLLDRSGGGTQVVVELPLFNIGV